MLVAKRKQPALQILEGRVCFSLKVFFV
jgi:hypothetical protein